MAGIRVFYRKRDGPHRGEQGREHRRAMLSLGTFRVGVVLKGHGFCARINHPHAQSTSGTSVYPRPDTTKGWGCPDSGFVSVHGELVTEWGGR